MSTQPKAARPGRRRKSASYHAKGNIILDANGVVEYDWLDSPEQAKELCRLLNLGVDPKWDILGAVYRGELPEPGPNRHRVKARAKRNPPE